MLDKEGDLILNENRNSATQEDPMAGPQLLIEGIFLFSFETQTSINKVEFEEERAHILSK